MNIPQNNKKSKEEKLKEFAAQRATAPKNRQLNQPVKETPEWLKKAIKVDPRFSETKKKPGIVKRK